MYTSVCCGALPQYDFDTYFYEFQGKWYGLCGDCAEHTDFNHEEEE